jgi:octaprenyl-diphosphate synthase
MKASGGPLGPAVHPAKQAPGAPHAVDRLAALLAEDLAAVDAIIHQYMTSPVGVIPNLAAHLIDAGGKRIRPLITLAAARLLGGGGDGPRKLAAAVEFIHSATLLHDDVVDLSSMRRGKKAANLVWGNSASVLVGDFLFARSFNLMVETGDIQVLDILARAKTAALFAAAAKAGAVAAGRPGAEATALETYGRELGLAFQLVDDALDYGGLSAAMGKNAGDDFREGKVTLPVIFARDAGDESERAFWRRVVTGERTDDDFHRAVALVKRHDAIALTLDAARSHAEAANAALSALPANAYREALEALPEFVVERGY